MVSRPRGIASSTDHSSWTISQILRDRQRRAGARLLRCIASISRLKLCHPPPRKEAAKSPWRFLGTVEQDQCLEATFDGVSCDVNRGGMSLALEQELGFRESLGGHPEELPGIIREVLGILLMGDRGMVMTVLGRSTFRGFRGSNAR